jgi:hypothetical protein
VAAANVVQFAVIGLADHGVDRAHSLVARLRQRPFDRARHRLGDVQCVGKQDRRLDIAQLRHLGRSGELAEGVGDEETRGYLVLEQVAAMRQDRRDAVCTALPRSIVTCPTLTAATSVIALSGPVGRMPTTTPASRARGPEVAGVDNSRALTASRAAFTSRNALKSLRSRGPDRFDCAGRKLCCAGKM